jgi:hypothetical protein
MLNAVYLMQITFFFKYLNKKKNLLKFSLIPLVKNIYFLYLSFSINIELKS